MKKLLLIPLIAMAFLVTTVSATYPDSIESKTDIQLLLRNWTGTPTEFMDTLEYACDNVEGVDNRVRDGCDIKSESCNRMNFQVREYDGGNKASIYCSAIHSEWVKECKTITEPERTYTFRFWGRTFTRIIPERTYTSCSTNYVKTYNGMWSITGLEVNQSNPMPHRWISYIYGTTDFVFPLP